MSHFQSENLNRWIKKGAFGKLNCRLGEFSVFYIDENNVDKNSVDKNEGDTPETLLLIHGFPTSSYDFDGIWNTLSKRFRLVTLDMLGFGFSDKPNHREYTIHQQADLFESLISELELDSFHVVAHDYGVSVAQELLARQLDGNGIGNWKSCLLLNGGLFPETHRALLIQKLMLSPLGKWINKLTGISAFSKSFSSVFGENTKPSQKELAEFWEVICHNDGRHLFHNLITYILDRREHRQRWLDALKQAHVPMALVNGSVDPVSGAHLVDRYKELECRLDYLKQLPSIGHYPQVEAPTEVSHSIIEFINSID